MPIRIKFITSLTAAPQSIEIIGFLSSLCDCNIEFVIVSIAVKNTDTERIDKSGAALFTDSAFLLKSIASIGFDNIDIPMAQGIEIIAANLSDAFIALADFSVLFSVLVEASAGGNADAIGAISADGKCVRVTTSVL